MNSVITLPGIMLCKLLMCSWVMPLSVQTLSMKRATNLTTELATSLFSESSNPLSVSKLSATLPAMLRSTRVKGEVHVTASNTIQHEFGDLTC